MLSGYNIHITKNTNLVALETGVAVS